LTFTAVRSVNPSPYLFLLELEGFSLVGASPKFMCAARNRLKSVPLRQRGGAARTRPKTPTGKGTARRSEGTRRARHARDLARNDIAACAISAAWW